MTGLVGSVVGGPVGWILGALGAVRKAIGAAVGWASENSTHLVVAVAAIAFVVLGAHDWFGRREAAHWHRTADKCAEARKADQAAAAARLAANQTRIDTRSEVYANDRAAGAAAQRDRETQIRTIYKTRVVPGVCAAPDDARRVLDDAVSAANARARGEPGRVVPIPAGTAPAAARP